MIAVCRKMLEAGLIIPVAILTLAAGAGELVRPAEREPDIDRIIHEMERVRSRIEDLAAVVDRAVVTPEPGSGAVSRITLSFKNPDKLKTVVDGGREVLINGDRMWIYSPDLKLVEEYLLKDENQRRAVLYEMSWGLTSPIRVLLRGTQKFSSRLEDGTYLVTVIPDGAETEIQRIRAWIDPRTWLIERMEIVPVSGSPVELKIREWKINSGLSDSFFGFRLPEGAELFEPLETGGEVIQ